MMITISKEQIHFDFDPKETPAAYAGSGDIVKFCCQDAYCEQILTDEVQSPVMCSVWKSRPLTLLHPVACVREPALEYMKSKGAIAADFSLKRGQ